MSNFFKHFKTWNFKNALKDFEKSKYLYLNSLKMFIIIYLLIF